MTKFKRVLSSDDVFDLHEKYDGCVFKVIEAAEQAVLSKLAEQEPVMYARTYYGEIDWDEACVTEKNDGALVHATDMRKEDFVRHGYAVIPLYAHPMPSVSNTSDKEGCVSESGESDTQRHLEYIKRYQKWRRGEDKTMSEAGINPKQLGESLDWLIAFAENHIADSAKMVDSADEALRKELDLVGLDMGAYSSPKEAIAALIDWHVSVATDPKTNGGWQLVPKEPTMDMIKALLETIVTNSRGGVVNPKTTLTYALAAAPKYTGK